MRRLDQSCGRVIAKEIRIWLAVGGGGSEENVLDYE